MYFEIVDNMTLEDADQSKMNDCFVPRSSRTSCNFIFGVPILVEDSLDHTFFSTTQRNSLGRSVCFPLQALMDKNSSRWWSIKHFMSNVADTQEGRPFIMEDFLRKVKDHDDHVIVYEKSRNLVYIEVRNALVDADFPDVPKREDEPWQFILCG